MTNNMIEQNRQGDSVNTAAVNQNIVETDVRLLGDKTTISQIVQLLAYIRHAVQQNCQAEIKVSIGKHVINTPLVMDVNDTEIKDYVTQPTIDIN